MLKKNDLSILGMLRKNARMSLTKIGKKTKVPISTVYDRMRHHEKSAIKKYTTLLDFNEFGFTTRVHMLIAMPKEKRKEAEQFFCKHHNVNSVYKINNNYEFLIEAVFKHIKQLEDFNDLLEQRFNTTTIEVHHIIYDIVREAFMEDPNISKALIKDKE